MLDDRLIPAFLDASCLVAAAGSPAGGSSVLFHVCGLINDGHVSAPVLMEAEGNIHAKLPAAAWERWQYLLLTTPLTVAEIPRNAVRYAGAVTRKDAHVYAAALGARVPYLITLDRPLLQRVNDLGGFVQALTPGEFIRKLLRSPR